jgi:hypothetical protein
MTKLAVVLFALAACGDDPSPAAEPAGSGSPPTNEIQVIRPRTENALPVPAPAGGELPAECVAFRQTLDKLATCDRLGDQRDVLRAEFDKSWRAWDQLPADQRGDLGKKCATASQNLHSAVAAACNW